MSSLKYVVNTFGWPGMNSDAFWSLSERIDFCFQFVKIEDDLSIYELIPKDGRLLKAPFDAVYNIRLEFLYPCRASLYFNDTCIETISGEELEFDTFTTETPMPIGLFNSTDKLILKIRGRSPEPFIGSCRFLRFNWLHTDKPFLIATTCTVALMYDGSKIKSILSFLQPETNSSEASSLSSTTKNLLNDMTEDNNNIDLNELFSSNANVKSLRDYINKDESHSNE